MEMLQLQPLLGFGNQGSRRRRRRRRGCFVAPISRAFDAAEKINFNVKSFEFGRRTFSQAPAAGRQAARRSPLALRRCLFCPVQCLPCKQWVGWLFQSFLHNRKRRAGRERDGKGSQELTDELALPHCLRFPQQVHVAGLQRYINCLACLWEKKKWDNFVEKREKKQLVHMRKNVPLCSLYVWR